LKNSFSIFIPILGFSLGILLLVAMTFYAKGKQESYLYEISVRGAAGKWLSQNTSPTNLVFTESLGYVGFFSNNSFIDWPGLASPQVPDLLVRNGVQGNRQKAYDTIIFTYKPDFLVLRVEEWEKLASNIKEKYFVCENFPARSGVPYLIAGQVCPN
jgi:hypothetical protein